MDSWAPASASAASAESTRPDFAVAPATPELPNDLSRSPVRKAPHSEVETTEAGLEPMNDTDDFASAVTSSYLVLEQNLQAMKAQTWKSASALQKGARRKAPVHADGSRVRPARGPHGL
eukprot:GHVU01095860.1.p2 GENE.GHVU01095860.1~~GHVU01095860.1.p2  ORF type:complete len:119 (+),score=10.46 GHVU01095860.1:275-631(+)